MTPASLATLDGRLALAAAQAGRASERVVQAAARTGELREQLDRVQNAVGAAQDVLDHQLTAIYEAGPPSAWQTLFAGLSPLSVDEGMLGQQRTVSVDTALLGRVERGRHALLALQAQSAGARRALLSAARAAFAVQSAARRLLASAALTYAGDLAAQSQRDQLAAQSRLAAMRATLDAQSRAIALASLPTLTPAGSAASVGQVPVLSLLENTPGAALPAGYHATGAALTGIASWYGPGFIGLPTSSGAPYDPEQLTAAMLTVPLGTVVHVQTAGGAAVNVLVNDRGPYVPGRIIDLSEAAAAALGIGLAPVSVTVLAPG